MRWLLPGGLFLLAAAALPLVFGSMWSYGLSTEGVIRPARHDVTFRQVFTDDDGVVNDASLDPADDGIDPGMGKAVAQCTGALDTEGRVRFTISNGYAGYSCRLWVRVANTRARAVQQRPFGITTHGRISVVPLSDASGAILNPGSEMAFGFAISIDPDAAQRASYTFSIAVPFREVR
jgi:hypothetical protein